MRTFLCLSNVRVLRDNSLSWYCFSLAISAFLNKSSHFSSVYSSQTQNKNGEKKMSAARERLVKNTPNRQKNTQKKAAARASNGKHKSFFKNGIQTKDVVSGCVGKSKTRQLKNREVVSGLLLHTQTGR